MPWPDDIRSEETKFGPGSEPVTENRRRECTCRPAPLKTPIKNKGCSTNTSGLGRCLGVPATLPPPIGRGQRRARPAVGSYMGHGCRSVPTPPTLFPCHRASSSKKACHSPPPRCAPMDGTANDVIPHRAPPKTGFLQLSTSGYPATPQATVGRANGGTFSPDSAGSAVQPHGWAHGAIKGLPAMLSGSWRRS